MSLEEKMLDRVCRGRICFKIPCMKYIVLVSKFSVVIFFVFQNFLYLIFSCFTIPCMHSVFLFQKSPAVCFLFLFLKFPVCTLSPCFKTTELYVIFFLFQNSPAICDLSLLFQN